MKVKSRGSRAEVMHGTARRTSGGLRKQHLKYNKRGKIVSKRASARAKKENRLVKAGYKTKKGQFGSFRKGKRVSARRSRRKSKRHSRRRQKGGDDGKGDTYRVTDKGEWRKELRRRHLITPTGSDAHTGDDPCAGRRCLSKAATSAP